MSDSSSHGVGVVAIGRNEGERLVRCLASIPPTLPVVYVDSGSADGSIQAARAAGALVVELDISIPFTAARARNEGWNALVASNPELRYVQFVDGDCEFETGWIENAHMFLESHDDLAIVCGRRRERFPNASFYNHLCDREWNTPIGQADACGGDAMARLSALRAVDGYNPALMAGEEPEMCLRLRRAGWRVERLDLPMTIHDAAMLRLRQWLKRAKRSGFGYAQVWHATRRGPGALYGRELNRAIIWAGLVPSIAIGLAVLVDVRLILLAPLLWAAQVLRYGRKVGLRAAALFLVGKFYELGGAFAFLRQKLGRSATHAITYK